jgi:hypothetical protein
MGTLVARREEPGSSIGTPVAKRSHFLNGVGKRNALKQLSEWTTVGITIESNQVEILVQRIDQELTEGNKTLEKLRFVDDDHLESNKILHHQIVERSHGNAGSPLASVCDNLVATVSNVVGMLNHQDWSVDRRIPRDDVNNPTRLPRKHGTQNQMKGHLRTTSEIPVNGHRSDPRRLRCNRTCDLRTLRSRERMENQPVAAAPWDEAVNIR